ncbi:MAG: hypothetical protein KGZ89_03035 [Actinobacteria bacterium]|nr:hypothetical protein [Actinomycetota bacterium]
MCYALFIGTDIELDVPDVEVAVYADAFHLETLQDEHHIVLPHFSKPFVYYAASWQGCGCGWFKDSLLLALPKKRRRSNERTAADLRSLVGLLGDLGTSELFLSWEGELDGGVLRRLELAPGDFEADSIPLEQGDFVVVRAAGPS